MAVQLGVREFRDADDGYLGWLAGHADGYVVNILSSHKSAGAKLHRAICWTIEGRPSRGGTWTEGDYVKVCADDLAELDQWAIDAVGETIPRCGTCQPATTAAQSNSNEGL